MATVSAASTNAAKAASTMHINVKPRKSRAKLTPTRAFLWATFLTPLVLLGGYFARPVPRIALPPRTEIVSQNGQMVARRIHSREGVSQLAIGRVGEKPLWTEDFSNEGIIAFSPDGRYIVTESTQAEDLSALIHYKPFVRISLMIVNATH